MSLLNDDSVFQDLLGQNTVTLNQVINDLDVEDSLTLEYVNANEVLITDADKKVISTNDLDVNSLTIPHDATNPGSIGGLSKALFFGNPSLSKVGLYSFSQGFLIFMVNNSVALTLNPSAFYPQTPKSHNLGSSSTRWNGIYGDTLDLETTFSCGTNATIGGNLLTDADNTNDIGDTTNSWKNLYINNIYMPNEATIDFGSGDHQILTTTTQIRFLVNGANRYYMTSTQFRPNSDNTRDLGTASVRWRDLFLSSNITAGGDITADGNGIFNTSSAGYVSMRELRSVDYTDPPTEDSFITAFGRRQFLQMRASDSPATTAGIMLSYFDTSNFYMYNSSSSGNFKIAYNNLISGVGGGSTNASDVLNIDTLGNLTASKNLNSTYQSQVEYWLDEENSYTETINATNTFQSFQDITSQTIAVNTTNFTLLTGGVVHLRYDGVETRKFLVKYKIIARRSGSGVKLFYTRLRRLNAIDGSRTSYPQSKSYHRIASSQTATFTGEAIITMLTNDRIIPEIKNRTDSTDIIVHSFSVVAYDLNYLG